MECALPKSRSDRIYRIDQAVNTKCVEWYQLVIELKATGEMIGDCAIEWLQ
ncbi:hypothetical protein ACEYW6_31230 [Nostoc sp. UIC 10607]|uniref:hypothetical protein n=1 Tax=Nostoc sp. UIC 10607 TaxID=3045935 RepID=UPI0039A1452E